MRFFLWSMLVTVAVLAAGLGYSSMVHCSRVDPSYPAALSNYFDARGFPYPWLVTDMGTCGELGSIDRIAWRELLRSILLVAAPTSVVLFLSGRRRRPTSRNR